MAIITQNHALNIVPGVSVPVVVHVSQGDTGVALEFTLLNGSTVFDPTGKAIAAHGIREDGAGWGPVVCTKVDGKIRFTLPAAATVLKGSGMAEVTIADSSGIVGTTNFAILVENATFPNGITYSNDVSVYEQILAYTQSAYGSLNARVDQLIAPSGEAPNPAEITDARIGVNNVTYPNLGTAIRTQIGDLNQELNAMGKVLNIVEPIELEQGAIHGDAGYSYEDLKTSSTTRVRTTDVIAVDPAKTYTIISEIGLDIAVTFFNDMKKSVSSSGWGDLPITITGYPYIAFALRFDDSHNIIPSDIASVVIVKNDSIMDMESVQEEHSQELDAMGKALNIVEPIELEQGAVWSEVGYSYEDLKTSSTTRVRTTDVIAVDPAKTYTIISEIGLDIAVTFFNDMKKSVSSSGWGDLPKTITGYPYIAFALRFDDSRDIIPSDIASVVIVKNDSIMDMESALDEQTTLVEHIASGEEYSVEFKKGIYEWDGSSMAFHDNDTRLSADLRTLGLSQGYTVGIEDYTKYSLAFGDNKNGQWYGGGYLSHDVTADNNNILPYIVLVKRNDNAAMTDTDVSNIYKQFHTTIPIYQIAPTKDFETAVKMCKRGYMHISFDDVTLCISNLIANSYESIFDEPFLKYLKYLHDHYGAVFSLFVLNIAATFGDNVPTRYQREFIDNSDWLKLGFHQYTSGSLNVDYETAKSYYNTFINKAYALCGGVNSIDRMPRLDLFGGSLATCQGLRDANCGIIGLLNTDDSRPAYYLSPEELAYLKAHGLYYDRTNGLAFADTVMRLDWFISGFSSDYTYTVPVENNPYDELVYRYKQPNMGMQYDKLIVFTHEWQIYNGTRLNGNAGLVEQACKFGRDYNYDFDFPQNVVTNITSFAL